MMLSHRPSLNASRLGQLMSGSSPLRLTRSGRYLSITLFQIS
jgi:hypothetical protein